MTLEICSSKLLLENLSVKLGLKVEDNQQCPK